MGMRSTCCIVGKGLYRILAHRNVGSHSRIVQFGRLRSSVPARCALLLFQDPSRTAFVLPLSPDTSISCSTLTVPAIQMKNDLCKLPERLT